MTIWAFNKPNEENFDFVCESLKQGVSRFGWSNKDTADLNILKEKDYKEFSEAELEIWDKSSFLLSIKKGDWIVHINVPERGKVTTGKVITEYKFDSFPRDDFRHYFILDKGSIIVFDRGDKKVNKRLKKRLKLRGRYWRIKVEKVFLRTLARFKRATQPSKNIKRISGTIKCIEKVSGVYDEIIQGVKKDRQESTFSKPTYKRGAIYGSNGSYRIIYGSYNYLFIVVFFQFTDEIHKEDIRELVRNECDWKNITEKRVSLLNDGLKGQGVDLLLNEEKREYGVDENMLKMLIRDKVLE